MTEDLTDEEDESWCTAQRQQVLTYLSDEGFLSPTVGEWPAWHITPIICVWAVESIKRPEWVGWWVISGDLPTDYTPCLGERHPRQALRDIGYRWRDGAANWADGKSADGWSLRTVGQESDLAPILEARAALILDIAADDSNWQE